jgi:hypothetical protein
VPIETNATDQPQNDVQELCNRLFNLAVEHEGIFHCEAHEEIDKILGRRFKQSWLYGRDDEMLTAAAPAPRPSWRHSEKLAARRGGVGTWVAQKRPGSWNPEVHRSLLDLGPKRHGSWVSMELVTPSIAGPVCRPWTGTLRLSTWKRRRWTVLEPINDSRRNQDEGDYGGLPPDETTRGQGLARTIRKSVYSRLSG